MQKILNSPECLDIWGFFSSAAVGIMHFYIQWLETWADDQSLISKPLRTLEMQYSDLKIW